MTPRPARFPGSGLNNHLPAVGTQPRHVPLALDPQEAHTAARQETRRESAAAVARGVASRHDRHTARRQSGEVPGSAAPPAAPSTRQHDQQGTRGLMRRRLMSGAARRAPSTDAQCGAGAAGSRGRIATASRVAQLRAASAGRHQETECHRRVTPAGQPLVGARWGVCPSRHHPHRTAALKLQHSCQRDRCHLWHHGIT